MCCFKDSAFNHWLEREGPGYYPCQWLVPLFLGHLLPAMPGNSKTGRRKQSDKIELESNIVSIGNINKPTARFAGKESFKNKSLQGNISSSLFVKKIFLKKQNLKVHYRTNIVHPVNFIQTTIFDCYSQFYESSILVYSLLLSTGHLELSTPNLGGQCFPWKGLNYGSQCHSLLPVLVVVATGDLISEELHINQSALGFPGERKGHSCKKKTCTEPFNVLSGSQGEGMWFLESSQMEFNLEGESCFGRHVK